MRRTRNFRTDKQVYCPSFSTHLSVAIKCKSILGIVYNFLGKNKDAKPLMEEVVDYLENTLGKVHPDTILEYSNLAVVLKRLGLDKKAMDKVKQAQIALQVHESTSDKVHPSAARICSNISGVLRELGEHEQSKIYSDKAVRYFKEIFGEEHPYVFKYNSLNKGYSTS